MLAEAYKARLSALGLLEFSVNGRASSPIGGATTQATHDHFALRFANSCSRIQAVALDPLTQFKSVSHQIIETFSSGHVRMLDLACGAGAASGTLLALVAELRAAGRLPTLPLTVNVTAGDISPDALAIFDKLMTDLSSAVAPLAMNVGWTVQQWDAAHPEQTARLCDQWLEIPGNEHFVCVANLSGVGMETFRKFERSFGHVGERIYGRKGMLIWVEPGQDKSRSFLEKVRTFFGNFIPWLEPTLTEKKPSAWSYRFVCPVKGTQVEASVIVQHYSRS